MEEKLYQLHKRINELTQEDICIAFSGGVDSSLLLKIASIEAKKNNTKVYAVTFNTRLHPKADANIAAVVAEECGAEHVILSIDEFDNKELLNNPINRCYICKKDLFQTLKTWAAERSINTVIDGTNADDLLVYRPGLKALRELEIISPLADCGVTKMETRAFSKELNLSVSDRPSAPCMATRLPYNTPITFEVIERLEKGEQYLASMGFETVRLRLHGDILRIEVPQNRLVELLKNKDDVINTLKTLGFIYITLDLEGFRSGSMDIKILSSL